MVQINKVYTRMGDSGKTQLAGGISVSKDHPRVEAYGTVDELNCLIGIVRNFNSEMPESIRSAKFEIILQVIQQRLFDLGSYLATKPGVAGLDKTDWITGDVKWLEDVIDKMNEELPPLTSFILPGGKSLVAFIHQSRAVCRRAERLIISLAKEEEVEASVIKYINRLSDALFVFGRWVNVNLEENEILWEPGKTLNPDWKWK
ncbi:MAG: cob(I)yrinic acid a,c-diamide adenosyltransferase [Nitrospinales bacterium]